MVLSLFGGSLLADEVVDIILQIHFDWVHRARWLKFQVKKAVPVNCVTAPAPTLV